MMECKEARSAELMLRGIIIPGAVGLPDSAPPPRREPQHQRQPHGDPLANTRFVPASVEEIEQHMKEAAEAVHPDSEIGGGSGEAPSLLAAIEQICCWGAATAAEREARLSVFEEVSRLLMPLTRAIREAVSPEHILKAPGPPAHVALFAVLAKVLNLDSTLAASLATGFDAVGEIDTSGVFRPTPDPVMVPEAKSYAKSEVVDFDTLNHAESATNMHERVEREGLHAAGEKLLMAQELWRTTLAEIAAGTVDPEVLSFEQVEQRFGHGGWRPMQAFGVMQGGKVRRCDNGRESLHNRGSIMHETINTENADFPVRAAGVYGRRLGSNGLELEAGTDDIASAYRVCLTTSPQYTVVCQWDPWGQEVKYVTMPGFNFGLKSAVVQFNRIPHFAVEVVRRLMAVCTAHYFDDFSVVEPTFARDPKGESSGQGALGRVMKALGFPLSAKKHVPAAACSVFLGVETDFSRLPLEGLIFAGVTQKRASDLAGDLRRMLQEGTLSEGEASSLCGRLGFVCNWCAYRFGRAALQPLYAQAGQQERAIGDKGRAPNGPESLSPAVIHALTFFESVLGAKGGFPKREFNVDAWKGLERTARVWTDAAAEPDSDELGRLGFVVEIPPDGGVGLPSYYHGTWEVTQEVLDYWRVSKQYIGQLELLAAVAVYYTLPDLLRGRKIMHFIDNTSAVAALIKGYSGKPDSALIVHAFHAWNLGLKASVWFEYVRSKANIADLPSRGVDTPDMLVALGSTYVEMVMPPLDDWTKPAAMWAAFAHIQRASKRKRNRGKRGRD
jgi:hypothetical protein